MAGRFAIAAAILAACLTAPPVHAATVPRAEYRFDVLGEAAVSNSFASVGGLVGLNDKGTAAFLMPAPSWYTLYVGTPGAVTAVPTPGVLPGGGVSINNHGRVALIALPADLPQASEFDFTAYAVTPGGPVTQMISRAAAGGRYGYGNMYFETGISDAGKVFATILALNAPVDFALTGDGTTTTELYWTFGRVGPPRMSSSGDYAFQDMGGGGGGLPSTPQAFRTNGMVIDRLFSFAYPGRGGGIFTSIAGGDVAANHLTVFNATWNSGPDELFTAHNYVDIHPVPGSQGFGGTVAINDFGTVAVQHRDGIRYTDPTALYVFHGDGPQLVLGEGDALLGSTVTALSFTPAGFNNLEQFAFVAHLADGRDVYVLASPVPEAGGMALVAAAGAMTLGRRRVAQAFGSGGGA